MKTSFFRRCCYHVVHDMMRYLVYALLLNIYDAIVCLLGCAYTHKIVCAIYVVRYYQGPGV